MPCPIPRRAALMILAAALGCVSAAGETVRLAPVADAGLSERDPTFNLGAEVDIPVGRLGSNTGTPNSRGLLRFDVAAAIPGGSVITAARLQFEVVAVPGGSGGGLPVDGPFAIFRMFEPWEEGTGAGALPGGRPALSGECCWLNRVHPTIGWEEPGGEIGEDFADQNSGEVVVTRRDSYLIELNARGLADVAGWLQSPSSNFGWALLSLRESQPKSARRIAMRESHNDDGPALEIEFCPSHEVPQLLPAFDHVAISESQDSIELRFFPVQGAVHTLEILLPNGSAWTDAASLPASNLPCTQTFQTPIPPGQSRALYRIRAESPDPL